MAQNKFDPNEIGEGINDINITPFVDVVLVLLVIFMVTAPVMIKESLNVKLPKTLTSDSASKVVTKGIAITKQGQIILEGSLIADEAFSEQLAKISKDSPDTHFLISADADSRHADLVKVIDLLKRYNLSQFALQVEKIKGDNSEKAP